MGMELSFYKEVPEIILSLKSKNVLIIGASRTAAPHIAQEILSLIHIDDTPAIQYFDSLQWGQGSKIKHITKASKLLKISPKDMVLVDDERRNRDVESIGVHFIHIPNEQIGLTTQIFEEGLEEWNNRNV